MFVHANKIRSRIKEEEDVDIEEEERGKKKKITSEKVRQNPCKVKRKNIIHNPKILVGMKSDLDPR